MAPFLPGSPRLSPSQKALAVHFGHFPSDGRAAASPQADAARRSRRARAGAGHAPIGPARAASRRRAGLDRRRAAAPARDGPPVGQPDRRRPTPVQAAGRAGRCSARRRQDAPTPSRARRPAARRRPRPSRRIDAGQPRAEPAAPPAEPRPPRAGRSALPPSADARLHAVPPAPAARTPTRRRRRRRAEARLAAAVGRSRRSAAAPRTAVAPPRPRSRRRSAPRRARDPHRQPRADADAGAAPAAAPRAGQSEPASGCRSRPAPTAPALPRRISAQFRGKAPALLGSRAAYIAACNADQPPAGRPVRQRARGAGLRQPAGARDVAGDHLDKRGGPGDRRGSGAANDSAPRIRTAQAKAPERSARAAPGRAPLDATNRLLVGRFASASEAQAFVNQLKAEQPSGFAWTSAAGAAGREAARQVSPRPLRLRSRGRSARAAARRRRRRSSKRGPRDAFQRDRDRIIHSIPFRRLRHKTQVFVAPDGDHFRVRLTHSLEVAQIGRTIARALGLNEDLTEALCLAHDIGHPPFGHAGEDALQAAMAEAGGFDHNAHTIRLLTRLESPYPRLRRPQPQLGDAGGAGQA